MNRPNRDPIFVGITLALLIFGFVSWKFATRHRLPRVPTKPYDLVTMVGKHHYHVLEENNGNTSHFDDQKAVADFWNLVKPPPSDIHLSTSMGYDYSAKEFVMEYDYDRHRQIHLQLLVRHFDEVLYIECRSAREMDRKEIGEIASPTRD